MRFRSKIDTWILLVLIVSIAGLLLAFAVVMVNETSDQARVIVALASVLAVALILSVLLRTNYTVDNGEIRIVSGPFRWTVPVSDILEIRGSRNPLSSPALSLNRLKIIYGHRKYILVSPADKKGFLRAVEQEKRVS